MGPLLIIVGVVVLILWSVLLGLILIAIGAVLTFVPAAPYGYSYWHGRRRPPP